MAKWMAVGVTGLALTGAACSNSNTDADADKVQDAERNVATTVDQNVKDDVAAVRSDFDAEWTKLKDGFDKIDQHVKDGKFPDSFSEGWDQFTSGLDEVESALKEEADGFGDSFKGAWSNFTDGLDQLESDLDSAGEGLEEDVKGDWENFHDGLHDLDEKIHDIL